MRQGSVSTTWTSLECKQEEWLRAKGGFCKNRGNAREAVLVTGLQHGSNAHVLSKRQGCLEWIRKEDARNTWQCAQYTVEEWQGQRCCASPAQNRGNCGKKRKDLPTGKPTPKATATAHTRAVHGIAHCSRCCVDLDWDEGNMARQAEGFLSLFPTNCQHA